MPIQDLIFAVGGLILSAALLPTVFGPDKPALSTCLLTAAVLVSFSISFASLGLWLAFAANAISATLWGVIALQIIVRRRGDQASGA